MLPKRLFRVILVGLAVAMSAGCIAVSLKGPMSVRIRPAEPSKEGVLGNLPELKSFKALRISSADATGGNADGGQTSPIKPREERVLAEIDGAGAITHIWVTIATRDEFHLRNLVLRMYWDGEEHPSVEAPIGDFFGLGHGKYYQYASKPLALGTNRGLNCFWRMPFGNGAKITLTNEGAVDVSAFYYYMDYQKYDDDPEKLARFHAQYRQEMPCQRDDNYLILSASGRGHYVGCNLSVELNADGWWGEGDDMIYVDGEEFPSLQGTGSEDYFCGAWGYGETFSNLYFGLPLRGPHQTGAHWNVYRYHIEDPIPFEDCITVTIEHGHANDRSDNFSSVAYWYQTEPHLPFAELPPAEERWPKHGRVYREPDAFEGEEIVPFVDAGDDKVEAQDMAGFDGEWSGGSQLLFKADEVDDMLKITVPPTEETASYDLTVFFTRAPDYGIVQVLLDDKPLGEPFDGYSDKVGRAPGLKLGRIAVDGSGVHVMAFKVVGKNPESAGYLMGIDCIKAQEVE